jgi:hypothetical protein
MFNGQDEKYNPPWRQDYRLKDQKVWPWAFCKLFEEKWKLH